MRYEILGPLRVVDERGESSISARKIEMLLAVLVVRANRAVTHDQLITEIWGEDPPRRVTAGLHVYVSHLRKFLSRPGRTGNPIVTCTPGYMLRLGDDELDAEVFLRLVREGRECVAQGRDDRACEFLEESLALWRGPVLADMQCGALLDGFVTWLTETRLECAELLVDAQLRLGRHREIIGRLYSLVAENPLRESFRRQLMLALYRSERTADALKVYQSARRALNDELGLDPCRSLQDLQRQILAADRQLDLCTA